MARAAATASAAVAEGGTQGEHSPSSSSQPRSAAPAAVRSADVPPCVRRDSGGDQVDAALEVGKWGGGGG